MEVMSDAARKELHALVDALPDDAVTRMRQILQEEISIAIDGGDAMDAEDRAQVTAGIRGALLRMEQGQAVPARQAIEVNRRRR